MALGTGMRRGELLGLRWQDVDLSVPQVQVAASLAHVLPTMDRGAAAAYQDLLAGRMDGAV